MLVSADYSQVEMRLMAHFSQDPALIDALQALAITTTLALALALPLPLVRCPGGTAPAAR